MGGRLWGPGHRGGGGGGSETLLAFQWMKDVRYTHLEVPDEGRDAAVRLVVVLLVGQLLQLGQEGDGVPRREQGQQVRG